MPGITTPLRPRQSRKPTCLPNPPMIVLCGPEKCGKSHEAARGTGSDLIGIAFWIEIGGSEGTADYYGRVDGANYEIVPHDGSYQDILDAIRWAVAQPQRVAGKPNMIVVDNGSNLWEMISDEQALFARRRAVNKAQDNRRRAPGLDDPVVVDPDLWNRAKDRWGEILWMLRRHAGPVVMIARQEIVTAFENDKPTRNTTRKIKAEKNLPAAVDAIVEMRGIGDAYLTGVRTLHWNVKPGETERFDDFSIDALLRRMGFAEAATHRQVTESRPEAYLDEQQQRQEHPQQQGQQRPQQQGGQQQGGQPQQQGTEPTAPTGQELVGLVHKALHDKTDPEACLLDIREMWGRRTLERIPTRTKLWGEMDANALITRSLQAVKERAKKKEQDATTGQGNRSTQQGQEPNTSPAPQDRKPEQAREHQAHQEPEPPAEYDSAPPPPDPAAEEPPPMDESPEETSAAEEPQDAPAARPATTPPREDRKKTIALDALDAEADIQARLKMLTVGEHLGPISQNGDPGMTVLRDYLQAQRPALIAQLQEEGHPELAAAYKAAPPVDTQIRKKFAAYFEGAPTGAVK